MEGSAVQTELRAEGAWLGAAMQTGGECSRPFSVANGGLLPGACGLGFELPGSHTDIW